MRSLSEYIKEVAISIASSDNTDVYDFINLKATWHTVPQDIIVQVPKGMSTDNMSQYLQYKMMNASPCGEKWLDKLYGDNAQYVIDGYVKYDNMAVVPDATPADIPYDATYDAGEDVDVSKLENRKLTGMTVSISFSDFCVYATNEDTARSNMQSVFDNTASSDANKWIVEMHLSHNGITYDSIEKNPQL